MIEPVNYNETHWTERKAIREKYIIDQEGKCYHCKCSLSDAPSDEVVGTKINAKLFPAGFFDYPVHLHHDHNTHMTIGAVHSKCNAVLWQYYGE